MKRIIRLTESDLTRIVRRVISEEENKSFLSPFITQFLSKYKFEKSGPETAGTVTYTKTVEKNHPEMPWNKYDTLYLIFKETPTPQKVVFRFEVGELDKDHVQKSRGGSERTITNDNNGTASMQQMLDFDKEHNYVDWTANAVYF